MSNPDERAFEGEKALTDENVYVSLTYEPLDTNQALSRVKSPKAGAVVLFAGIYLPPFLDQTQLLPWYCALEIYGIIG